MAMSHRCASCLPAFSTNCIARCDDSPPNSGSADHHAAMSEDCTTFCAPAGTAQATASRHAAAREVRNFIRGNVPEPPAASTSDALVDTTGPPKRCYCAASASATACRKLAAADHSASASISGSVQALSKNDLSGP